MMESVLDGFSGVVRSVLVVLAIFMVSGGVGMDGGVVGSVLEEMIIEAENRGVD